MLDFLLNFLGLNSWYVNFYPCKKYKINTVYKEYKEYNKNLKTVNKLNLLDQETPSPKFPTYSINKITDTTFSTKLKLSIYTLYSCVIFLFLCVQPIYTLVKFFNETLDTKLLVSFFINVNIPIIYFWQKMYFKTNHLELHLKCEKFKTLLIIASCGISILLNLIDIESFHNDYYWLHYFDTEWFFTIIIIEWIYSRLVLFLFVYSFIFILNSHINKFTKIILDIDNNEFSFEENACLSNIILEISKIRHEIEVTISYYNDVISLNTIFGGMSLAVFTRDIYTDNKIIIDIHDRYLIKPIIFYIISQGLLLFNMSRYSYKRDSVLKYIKSISFITRFLTRVPSNKIMKKSGGNINIVILNILEETSTSLDWLLLGNMLSEKWLDFTIFGISTSDGKLIKKSITFGCSILFILSFFNY
jgi:hypothetical protein